jgi:hypothetical protein
MIRPCDTGINVIKGHRDGQDGNDMKLAALILSQFARSKSNEPDAFEKRLSMMGKETKRRSRVALPSLFIRHANVA